MPHSGGSATNAGIYYQNWFLALQFSYAFFEKNYVIKPEALNKFVDDIFIDHNSKEFYFSLKYRSPSKGLNWTLCNLKSENILIDFKKQFERNPLCEIYLVSESNCYLFSEVFVRARNALGQHDILENLKSKICIKEWIKVKEVLEFDDFQLIDFAKRVNILTIPNREIKYLVKHRFQHASNYKIDSFLFEKAVDCSSLKTRVTRNTLIDWFQEEGIELKTLVK